jgi:hypothetical protein
MRPASLRVFVLAALSSALPLACASLLGDFSAGVTGSSSDGGEKDGATPVTDGAGPGSDGGGATEAGAQDGPGASDGGGGADGSESGTAPAQLTCAVPNGTFPQSIGAVQFSQNNYNPRIFNTTVGNQTQFRVAVQEQPQNAQGTYHVYTFGQGGNNSTDTPTPQSAVLDLVRYPTGIGALMSANIQSGQENYNVLQVSTLEDMATAWTTPVQITTTTQITTDCGSNNYNLRGGLLVNNAATQSYTAVWSCNSNVTNPAQNILRAMMYAAGTGTPVDWPTPPLDDGGAADGLQLGGMAATSQNLYVLVNANGNGPAPGAVPTIYTASTASATTFAAPSTYAVPLTNPTDFMQAVALQGTNGGNLGFAGVEANLTTTTLTPYLYVGSVPPAEIGALVPSTQLGATPIANLSSLPVVNNGSAHWESFPGAPASDNLIAVGAIYPNSNGLNFMWFNGQGNVVAQRLDTKAFLYFSTDDGGTGPTIYGGDLTFNGEPAPALANLELVYLQEGELNDGGPGVQIWGTQVDCIRNQ